MRPAAQHIKIARVPVVGFVCACVCVCVCVQANVSVRECVGVRLRVCMCERMAPGTASLLPTRRNHIKVPRR